MPIHARIRPEVAIARRPLALWLGEALAVLALTAAACSPEPSCPDGKRKVGTRCVGVEGDAGASEADASDSQDDAAVATCLVDEDGDGFGVEMPGGPCQSDVRLGDCDDADPEVHPEALDVCGDQRDNDCDGEVDEGVPEQCDGEDNDCDGVVDNGFMCIPGTEEVTCTTICGTEGLGTCTDSCGPAPVAECTPPAEVCNWIDDDCDGVADPNMLQRASSEASRVYTQSSMGTPTHAQVAVLPRPQGGAWWLYRSQNVEEYPSSLRVFELSAEGEPINSRNVELSSGTLHFTAAAQGDWIAVLSTQVPSFNELRNDSYRLKLQLFRAADWNPVGSIDLVSNVDDDDDYLDFDDHNDCGFVRPVRVSVAEGAEGEVYVAALSVEAPAVKGTGGCSDAVTYRLRTATFLPGSNVTQHPFITIPTNYGDSRAFDLARVPCRNEWLVAYAADSGPSGTILRRYGWMGATLGEAARVTGDGVFARLGIDERCDEESSEVALLWQVPGTDKASEADKTMLRRWSVSKEPKFSPLGDELVVAQQAWLDGQLLRSRGRWFAAALVKGDAFDAKTAFFELSLTESAVSQREISLFVPSVSGANPGSVAWPFGLLYGGMLAAADVGGALVVGVSRGLSGSNFDNLRAPGDSDPAVAATYRVTCP